MLHSIGKRCMKQKLGLHLISATFSMLLVILCSSCTATPLLRYGDRESCQGYFGTGLVDTPDFYFPMQARYAELVVRYNEVSNSFLILDSNENLYRINKAGTGEIEQINVRPIRNGTLLELPGKPDIASKQSQHDNNLAVWG